MDKKTEEKAIEEKAIKEKVDVDELRQECKNIEHQHQEFEEAMTTIERKDADYLSEFQSEKNQIESLREDCQGDKAMLDLVDEQAEKMKKVEYAGKELQDAIRSERKKEESKTQEALSSLRKQMAESEV